MKSSPQLRRSRPQIPPVDLDRLKSLDAWTTQPEQSRALVEPSIAPVEPADAPAAPEPLPAPVETPASPAAAPVDVHPWDSILPVEMKAYHLVMSKRLHMKLKWIGDTTYDSSMRKFILAVLEEAADRTLKERSQ